MIPKELLRKIRYIQIRTSHMVNAALAGQYHSAFKGRGMEFEEVRPYQPGDDIRTIDWNVTARYGEPFVKVYREERELTVMLLVDMSPSGMFGSTGQFKIDVASELCAVLAFSAIKSNDKVGLIIFSDQVEKFVPPAKGQRHVLRVVRELLFCKPTGKGTDIASALRYLDQVTVRRTVCFLVSDFQAVGFEQALRIARRRHDLIPISITDPREAAMPDVGLVELMDPETGRTITVDTSSRSFRRRYEAHAEEIVEERNRMFRRMDVDPIDIRTDQSMVEPLTRYFRRRERKL
jgi:uncharacterized protein (DUF58 family)